MSIFENIVHNSKINFYLILTIFFIILFYPSTKKNNNNSSYNKVSISNNLKQLTKYAILN
tara:strand:+ start:5563 stop:5742 length:180 start_codon:yes stop_codon:yes gene_type:complete